MKYFVILFVVGIAVCVSAHSEHEKDIRPYCFRNLTAEEEKIKEGVLKGCAEKKGKEDFLCKMTCFKMVTPDGKMNETTVLGNIEKFALAEYKEQLKKESASCMLADKDMKGYFKCLREHEKTLPCKTHKHCHHHNHKHGDSHGEEHGDSHGEEHEEDERMD